ncbi:hypothetical protein CAUP111243_08340 [Campylobacter upsaliensis]|uniref:Uncharacterized protein n=1 Tax=Campylobacter upsaliensis TaxID=28080 RepID=A0A448KKU3_CAMUP|nr:Uncharacterised protein [Campylobacter upsaliensis]
MQTKKINRLTHKDTSLSLYPLKSLKKSYAVLN